MMLWVVRKVCYCVYSVVTMLMMMFFFFFQAEDGIRDLTVTGVQTCALPIFRALPVPVGDVHLAGDRLPGRAHALRVAGAQLLLRRRRSGGVPEGSLLPVPERLDDTTHAARLPALELGARPDHRHLGLHPRR